MVFKPKYGSFFWLTCILSVLPCLLLIFVAAIEGFRDLSTDSFTCFWTLYFLFTAFDLLAGSYATDLTIDHGILIRRRVCKPLLLPVASVATITGKNTIKISRFIFLRQYIANWDDLVVFMQNAEAAGALRITHKEAMKMSKGRIALITIGAAVTLLIPIGLIIAAPYVFPQFCASNISNKYIFGYLYFILFLIVANIIGQMKKQKE